MALELGSVGTASSEAGAGQRLLFVDQRIFGGMFLSPLVPDIPAAVAGEMAPEEGTNPGADSNAVP